MKKTPCYIALLIAVLSPELRAASSAENDLFPGVHRWNTKPRLKNKEQVIKQTYISGNLAEDTCSLYLSISEYTSLTRIEEFHPSLTTHTISEVETVRMAWETNLMDRHRRYDDTQMAGEVPDSPVNERRALPLDAQDTQSEFVFFSQYTFSKKSVVSSEEGALEALYTDICTGATMGALLYLMIIFTRSLASKKKQTRKEKADN